MFCFLERLLQVQAHQAQEVQVQVHHQHNMSDFKIIINREFEMPDFSVGNGGDQLIREIAEKISFDCKRNIRQQNNVDGSPFVPLANKTLRNKRAKKSKYINKALMDTGKMIDAIDFQHAKLGKYTIGLNAVGKPRRDRLAVIHQIEGVNQKTRVTRVFFGINDRSWEWIERRLVRFVKQQSLKTRKTSKKVTK